MDSLIRSEWHGNVREMMNAMERAVVLSRSEYLDIEDFPMINNTAGCSARIPERDNFLSEPLDEVEKAAILKTLSLVGGNKSEAARQLGITRKTLREKLKKYGVTD